MSEMLHAHTQISIEGSTFPLQKKVEFSVVYALFSCSESFRFRQPLTYHGLFLFYHFLIDLYGSVTPVETMGWGWYSHFLLNSKSRFMLYSVSFLVQESL
jgi:hypothetical protein